MCRSDCTCLEEITPLPQASWLDFGEREGRGNGREVGEERREKGRRKNGGRRQRGNERGRKERTEKG